MGLFSRRRTEQDPAAVRAVAVDALHTPAGWVFVSGTSASSEPDPGEDPGDSVAAGVPSALRRSWQSALTGGRSRPFPEDLANHRLVRGDWVAAIAAGVRPFSVLVDDAGVVVLRRGLATSVQGDPELVNTGDGPTEKLALPGIPGWRDLIDTAAWSQQPAWTSVAGFLEQNTGRSGLVSSWWEPDPDDRTVGAGPLWPRFAKGNVTAFLNGTEDRPDPQGPPGVGFADPGFTGRWLWLHRWAPFDGRPPARAFTGAVGLVADADGVVRCFRWPDRGTVQRVAVRGRTEWPVSDRRRVTGVYTELAGAEDLPSDWEITHD